MAPRSRLGRPEPADVVLFRPDEASIACCENVCEEWCQNSNFFETKEAAGSWAMAHGMDGRVLTLAEASRLAVREWEPLVSGCVWQLPCRHRGRRSGRPSGLNWRS